MLAEVTEARRAYGAGEDQTLQDSSIGLNKPHELHGYHS